MTDNSTNPTPIEMAWDTYRAEMLARDAYLKSLGDADEDSAEANAHHDRMSGLESELIGADATTLREIEMQAWVALYHSGGFGFSARELEPALAERDAAVLLTVLPDLDFDAKCIAKVIIGLRAMQPDSAAWDAAYAVWREIDAEWTRLGDLANPIDGWLDTPEEDAAQEELKRRSPEFREARDAFMEVPAPHFTAVAIKQAVALSSMDHGHAEIVAADLDRLVGKEV